jgi:putative NADH-flavin reductase
MTLAVFGLTGSTGKVFWPLALQRGYRLRALVRNPSRLEKEPPGLEIIPGDATNPSDVERVLRGAEVVVSLLGHAKKSPPDLQQRFGRSLLQVMQRAGPSRLLMLTGNGVFLPKDRPTWLDKLQRTALGLVDSDRLQDGQKHAEQIMQTSLDWTIVRTPLQTNGPRRGRVNIGYLGSTQLGFTVSRQNICLFILNILNDPEYFSQAPVIANPWV